MAIYGSLYRIEAALEIIAKEKRRNKVHFKGEQTFTWEETETIHQALSKPGE